MSRPDKKAHIYTPSNVSELLSVRKAHPRSVPFAGGTFLMSGFSDSMPAGEILFLGSVPDLSRLSRTESYLEIGSCVTLERLLSLRRYLGKRALFSAIETLGTAPIRASATIGGNIGLASKTVNLLPILYLLETRIEIRKSGGSSWVPIRKYYEGAEETGHDGIITRIRIPVARKNFERYELICERSGLEPNALSFCAVADIHKEGILSSMHCAFCVQGAGVIRDMEMESIIEGKKLPLYRKDLTRAVESLEAALEALPTPVLSIRKHQMIGLLKDTLAGLGEE